MPNRVELWCTATVVTLLLGVLPVCAADSPLDRLDRTLVPDRLPTAVVAVISTPGNGIFDLQPCAFSSDGAMLAAIEGNNCVRFWHFGHERPREGHLLEVGTGRASALTLSLDKKTLAIAGDKHGLELWDISSPKPRLSATVNNQDRLLWALTFSSSGKLIAGASAEGTVRTWELENGNLRERSRWKDARLVRHLTFSPDNRTLAIAGDGPSVGLWEVATGRERARLKGHSLAVTGLHFAEAGRWLTTIDYDGTVRKWNLTNDELPVVQGESAAEQEEVPVSSTGALATTFPALGRRRIFSHIDDVVTLWQAPSKISCECRLPGTVGKMTWAPDGRHLAVTQDQGYVFILRLPR